MTLNHAKGVEKELEFYQLPAGSSQLVIVLQFFRLVDKISKAIISQIP